MTPLLVLNPWISYKGLKTDYADVLMLSDHLKQSKANLFNYFDEHYANANTPMSLTPFFLE
jgi:hypothetical protein